MGSRRSQKYDFLLLGVVFILLILGILMVYSASSVRALETYNDSIHFLTRHAFRVGLGIIVAIFRDKETTNVDDINLLKG